jgi:hypothetical protein
MNGGQKKGKAEQHHRQASSPGMCSPVLNAHQFSFMPVSYGRLIYPLYLRGRPHKEHSQPHQPEKFTSVADMHEAAQSDASETFMH